MAGAGYDEEIVAQRGVHGAEPDGDIVPGNGLAGSRDLEPVLNRAMHVEVEDRLKLTWADFGGQCFEGGKELDRAPDFETC